MKQYYLKKYFQIIINKELFPGTWDKNVYFIFPFDERNHASSIIGKKKQKKKKKGNWIL